MKDPNKFSRDDEEFFNTPPIRKGNIGRTGMDLVAMQEKIDKEIRYYEDEFENRIHDWIASGVSQTLASGKFDDDIKTEWAKKGFDAGDAKINTDSTFAQKGFSALEKNKIARDIGIEDGDYYDALRAERIVESTISHDIANTTEVVDPDVLERAKLDGVLYNVRTGAKIIQDGFGEEVQFMIPPDKKKEAWLFMTNMGLDFHEYKEDSEVVKASHEGFANIIKIISDTENEKVKKTGIDTLNWYFDSFRFSEHMSDFVGDMMGVYENESRAWKETYDNYTDSRDEFKRFYEEQKEIPRLISATKLTEEEFYKLMRGEIVSNPNIDGLTVFDKPLRKSKNDSENKPKTSGKNRERYFIPAELKKCKLIEEFQGMKAIDEEADPYDTYFRTKNGDLVHYIALRFGMHNKNIVVCAPIKEASSDASYVWAGETGYDRDGWQKAFQAPDNTDNLYSKNIARKNSNVTAHSHKPNKKLGLDGVQNMWRNIWYDIEKRTRLDEEKNGS